MNTKTLLFTGTSMIIAVIFLTVTIPIDICMGHYLHAFITCFWIYISICAYRMAIEILKLKGLIAQIEQIFEEQHNRKDAFIEKACTYLKENRDKVKTEDNGIMGWIEDEFIEDFKTFMKGDEV